MILFIHDQLEAMHRTARDRPVETCAFGLVTPVGGQRDSARYAVREFIEVPASAYLERSGTSASLSPGFCMETANRARAANAGVLLAHTHPGSTPLLAFSAQDDAGEVPLAKYFNHRVPHRHFSAVVTGQHVLARPLGSRARVSAAMVGPTLRLHAEDIGDSVVAHEYDRQVRAFGVDGQRALARLRVGIVGLGGTGSVVALQLAHLGVADFVLIDPDRIEVTNLNRLVGTTPADIGRAKVDQAARTILAINPKAQCQPITDDVVNADIADSLKSVDFIFSCTDSMASRAVVNQLAYQYLVPCIDMGVAIKVAEGSVQYITGRVQMLAPGLPCLACTNLLDSEQVRVEMLSEEQRRLDPYIKGATIPQPAVISLNSTIASMAVTMFLSATSGFASEARMVVYDGMRGVTRPTVMNPQRGCIVCSPDGALAKASGWNLPTRTRGRHD